MARPQEPTKPQDSHSMMSAQIDALARDIYVLLVTSSSVNTTTLEKLAEMARDRAEVFYGVKAKQEAA